MLLQGKVCKFLIPFGICLVSGGLFLIILQAIEHGTIENFDLPIIQFVQGMEVASLTFVLKTFTWIGSGFGVAPITLLICVLLFFKYNKRSQAVLFAFAIVSTILLNEGLKRVFVRDRPEIHRLMDAGGFSFPSGHTMMAVSLYAMIVYVAWPHVKNTSKRCLLVLGASLFVFLIAGSRIYVGVHFPSDIAGGFLMSTFWLTIVLTIYHLFKSRSVIR